jgi:hypothetical protein
MSIRVALAGAAGLALTAAGLLSAAPASAAPLHSGNTFGAMCPSPYGTIQVVGTPGNGQGRFTPGFVVGTHLLGVPYSVTTLGGPTLSKAGPVPKGAITCALLGPDGSVVGSVTVAVRGKP